MLRKLADLFFASEPSTPESRNFQLPLATCVLLLEAARTDDEFTEVEREHIAAVLRQRFEVDQAEAERIMEEASSVREESSDIWRFTHAVNAACSIDEKIQVMEEVWRIVLSDGILNGREDHLVHKLQLLLNLNHPQMIGAKMKVLAEIREA